MDVHVEVQEAGETKTVRLRKVPILHLSPRYHELAPKDVRTKHGPWLKSECVACGEGT